MPHRLRRIPRLTGVLLTLVALTAHAETPKNGVSDTEIVIGQTMPYSGPASAYSAVGKAHLAFFERINAEGGIHGRRIRLISLDDAMSPPKTVEQVRMLVEGEDVLLIFGLLGSGNHAVQRYLNEHKIPHLFPSAASVKFHDSQNSPWTMGWVPTFYFEGETYARYLLRNRGQSKVAILYQNDEMGREYRDGFKSGLGSNAKRMLVGEASYEISDASVDSQIIQLKATGADALFSAVVTPKFGSQTIRKLDALDWHPLHFIAYPSASVGATLAPAGLDKSVGIISSYFAMDVSDPVNASNPEFKEWKGWFDRYVKDGDPSDGSYAYGYMQAQLLAQVLRQCGNDLSRENVLRQAQHLRNVHLPLTLPGVTINTSDTDYRPIKQLRMFKFNGKKWEGFGPLMGEK